MKSPYKIAKEIGVSPQAVYKKIDSMYNNQLLNKFNTKLNNQLLNHIEKKGNKILVDEIGEALIKSTFHALTIEPTIKPVEQPTIEPVAYQFNSQLSQEIAFLKEQNKILQEELNKEREHNRNQSEKLFHLAEQMAELTRNNQVLLKQEQDRNYTTLPSNRQNSSDSSSPNKNQKHSIWSIFKTNKKS